MAGQPITILQGLSWIPLRTLHPPEGGFGRLPEPVVEPKNIPEANLEVHYLEGGYTGRCLCRFKGLRGIAENMQNQYHLGFKK